MLFRRTAETEDLVALTALIRAAYAPHALKGLRYWATHQSVEDTARRLSRGVGFVGEVDGELVAIDSQVSEKLLDAIEKWRARDAAD